MNGIYKGRNGWEAKDVFDFEGDKKLTISTYKINGKIVALADVSEHKDGMVSHVFGGYTSGDFSERVVVCPGASGTEKAILYIHKLALSKRGEVEARARAFYAAQKEGGSVTQFHTNREVRLEKALRDVLSGLPELWGDYVKRGKVLLAVDEKAVDDALEALKEEA